MRYDDVRARLIVASRLACAGMAVLAAFGVKAHAAEMPAMKKWQSVAPVTVDMAAGKGMFEASLPPEIFAASQRQLTDLRLMTASGASVPFLVAWRDNRDVAVVEALPRQLLNRSSESGVKASVVADFGDNQVRSLLDVMTKGDNYRRRVMIEGGNDGVTWETLTKSGWIFAIPGPASAMRVSRLSVDKNNFRYYRITVFNSPDDPGDMVIESVRAGHGQKTPADTLPAEIRSMGMQPVRIQPTAQPVDMLVFDFGYENLPMAEVTLAFSDRNFLRRVTLYARNRTMRTVMQPVENAPPRKVEQEEPWQHVAADTVYRFTDGGTQEEHLTLPCRGVYRYLAVHIQNGDDAPLDFTGATALRLNARFRFQAPQTETLALFVGREDAMPERHDFAHFADRLIKEGIHKATVGAVAPNPGYSVEEEDVPWSERNRWILTVALGCILAVLGLIALRQARGIGNAAPPA